MNKIIINVVPNPKQQSVQIANELVAIFPDLFYKIFIGFPLFYPDNKVFRPDLLAITKKGVFFVSDRDDDLDDEYVFIESQLKKYSVLRSKHNLRFELDAFISKGPDESLSEIGRYLSNLQNSIDLSRDDMRLIESALTGLLKPEQLKAIANSESEILTFIRKINQGIRTFDEKQYQSIEGRTGQKVTSIRGLAGCGKTVVLSKIASNEIIADSSARICYTYQTRSMRDQVRTQIKDFLSSSGVQDYDSYLSKIEVMGAWGGFGNQGLLQSICHSLGIRPLSLDEAKYYDEFYPFEAFCDYVLKEMGDKKLPLYDLIIVDEAQDFRPNFLKICLNVLKDTGQLVYAYDDFQTLSDKSMPSALEIFGNEVSCETMVLDVCYRTPPQVLSLAHAIAMGLYSSPPSILQFPENASDWETLGYVFEKGNGAVGEQTVISRKAPEIFESLPSSVSCIRMIRTKSKEIDYSKVATSIVNDLKSGLDPNDLLIIDLDWSKINSDYLKLEKALLEYESTEDFSGVALYFAGSKTPDTFSIPHKITFSGVKRAKGNEAFVVYVLNAHLAMSKNLPIVNRNRLFTALTRSRLQSVLVMPYESPLSDELVNEMKLAKENDYNLSFIYPSQKEIKKIIAKAKNEVIVSNETEKMANRISEMAAKAKKNKLDVLENALRQELNEGELLQLLNMLNDKQ